MAGPETKIQSVEGHDLTGVPQMKICGQLCGARCCRYVTISIDPPRSAEDWDEIRWWLLHAGVSVYRDEEGDWAVCVETRCSNLTSDNLCGVWPNHPTICQEHDPTICEFRDADWYT